MDVILKQSYTFAKIGLVKNYVNIDDKFYFTPLFLTPFNGLNLRPVKYKKNFYTFELPSRKWGVYFYSGSDVPEYISLFRVMNNKSSFFYTNKIKHIKKYYGNLFASIEVYKIERTIRRDGDKIIVKNIHSLKNRFFNEIPFHRVYNSTTITFDLSKGNFLIVKYVLCGKKKTHKKFYSNSFGKLWSELSQFPHRLPSLEDNTLKLDILAEFDDKKFLSCLLSQFNFFFNRDTTSTKYLIEEFFSQWFLCFVNIKKIKLPDKCGNILLMNYYPTEKYLKKNKRKLVASILDRYGIKSDITIKIVHDVGDIDFTLLLEICALFGDDYKKYIGNIPRTYFYYGEVCDNKFRRFSRDILNVDITFKLDKKTKENVFKIICDSIQCSMNSNRNIASLLFDHFFMLERVNEYYPNYRLTAQTYSSFLEQHSHLSIIDRKIRDGWSYCRVYDEKFVEKIEQPIMIDIKSTDGVNTNDKIKFTPKILTTTDEYDEEGAYMHHCVNSYIKNKNSLIVSIRSGEERVTCEFNIRTKQCLQSRFFTNKEVPERFKNPVDVVSQRIKNYPHIIRFKQEQKPFITCIEH